MAYAFRDTFTEPSTTLLSVHSPDVGAGAWAKASWAAQDLSVIGGAGYAAGASSTSSSMYINSTTLEGDVDVTLTFQKETPTSATHTGVLLRVKTDGTREYYAVYIIDTLSVEKWVGGSLSATLISAQAISLTASTQHAMRVTISGGQINIYINGNSTPFATVTDSTPITADGYIGVLSRSSGRLYELSAEETSADTTAPTLTSATATATGATTASGSVTTNEANGTIYSVATSSATKPSKAQVKAGQDHTGSAAAWSASQAVSSTGAKSVSVTGLTAETTYYLHHMHEDAAENQSDVESSASFTTSGAFASTISVTDALKNNTGTLLVSQTGVKVAVLKAADLESVYEGTAMTDASGILSDITDAAIVAGAYHVVIKLTDGSVGITGAIEAV